MEAKGFRGPPVLLLLLGRLFLHRFRCRAWKRRGALLPKGVRNLTTPRS